MAHSDTSDKSSIISKLLDDAAKRSFGRTRTEAQTTHVCVMCGNPADTFKDALSAKEYSISGMCQACQDGFFVED